MIRVENISKSFGETRVLRDASMEVHDGETLAIIGRSGSGKSVMMKHLIGLLKPDAGRVLVGDTDINAIPYEELQEVRRRFGVLFQGGALFDSMTAFENVAFPLRTFTRMGEDEVQERAAKCLSLVQLEDIGDKKPAELSGGMQKRVALARAITLEPEYILYDEPTSGLDPETSNTINDLIRGLAEHLNATSIVVTHDMHSVLEIADRAAFVHDETIYWTGTIEAMHRCEDPVLCSFVKASEYRIGEPLASPSS